MVELQVKGRKGGGKKKDPFKIKRANLTIVTVIHKLISLGAVTESRNTKRFLKNEMFGCIYVRVCMCLNNVAEVNLYMSSI